jgi:hypothetical protein
LVLGRVRDAVRRANRRHHPAGTNNFHGTLFEFLRNDVLDAHNFFDAPGSKKQPLRRNTFGGVISGPIWIPKIYNGRNKTFFTFNGELYRERRSTQGFGIYPSARMKAGDLTETFFRRADGSFIPHDGPGYRRSLPRQSNPG